MGNLKLIRLLQPKQNSVHVVSHFIDRLVVHHIKSVVPGQLKHIILTVSIAGKGLKSICYVNQPLDQKGNPFALVQAPSDIFEYDIKRVRPSTTAGKFLCPDFFKGNKKKRKMAYQVGNPNFKKKTKNGLSGRQLKN